MSITIIIAQVLLPDNEKGGRFYGKSPLFFDSAQHLVARRKTEHQESGK
jgi:hypothetical protein